MLLYEASESKRLELKHEQWKRSDKGKTQIYYAPQDEFDLLNTKLGEGEEEIVREGINGPAVFIVTEGDAVLSPVDGEKEETLKQGQVVFVKPRTGYRLKATSEKAQVWGAFVEA
jgi:mannose-6-phosphate isomerase